MAVSPILSLSAKAGEPKLTPMMEQYCEIRAANPGFLLFYRMGDFYELFFEDAHVASQALGIILTHRGKHLGADIPMCGVPVDRRDEYLHRLIALGHKVAVCEQTEDPAEAKKRGPKSVVRRAVERLVTVGTLTEERLLEPRQANRLLALARVRHSEGDWSYGLAVTDISTGEVLLSAVSSERLSSELARFAPKEIVLPDNLITDPALKALFEDFDCVISPLARCANDVSSAQKRICDYYGLATIDGFGQLDRVEIMACAHLMTYIDLTQMDARPKLAVPQTSGASAFMEIDAATRANLELTQTLSGKREGSLGSAIDLCVTAGGSRLLHERLSAPLTSIEHIFQRQNALDFYLTNHDLRADIRTHLRQMPDFLRSLSRLSLDRGGPRDLAAVGLAINLARELAALLARQWGADETEPLRALLAALDETLWEEIERALEQNLPLKARDGGFIRAGFSAALDVERLLRDDSRKVIAQLQARYAQDTDYRQLKIKHNNFLGYFLEVNQVQGEKLLRAPFDTQFIHRQTMSDAMRFTTGELAELDRQIAGAGEKALAQEQVLFQAFRRRIDDNADHLRQIAALIGVIDVHSALAELAAQRRWRRPKVDGSRSFLIDEGRHPVVDRALSEKGQAFIPNSCALSDASGKQVHLAIMTGPNMAGKSTFLRQNALIAILAQIGSFVPAKQAHIGIVDRLFSRVGAADDLARGRSTFMVEMIETAAILNQAGERALVILDEIGRGTSTFDGLSIAWASVEHLHDKNRCRALFATHFHELTQLSDKLPHLTNLTMRVSEHEGHVVFLHEVAKGCADRSYGIQVAKLAGLPTGVIRRAEKILSDIETANRSAPLSQLQLFAFTESVAEVKVEKIEPKWTEELTQLDPDQLTPRAALEALYRLKHLQKQET